MGFINIPPNLKDIFDGIYTRLLKLETTQRFTAPNVTSDPTAFRNGDEWLNTTSNVFKRVDATGVVHGSTGAYFVSARYTAATPCTQGNDVIWDSVENNASGAYNATNGRFTAPIAGTYYFKAHGLFANADAGDMRMAIYKNGGTYAIRTICYKVASTWLTYHVLGSVVMAAGDYVTIRYEQGPTALYGDSGYNGFQCWLVS